MIFEIFLPLQYFWIFKKYIFSELFDESLIVLQQHLKWPLKDLVYFRKMERMIGANVRNSSSLTFEEEKEYQNLSRSYLTADDQIYKHFRQKMERQITELGSGFVIEKVEELKVLNLKTAAKCGFKKSFEKISYKPNHLFSNVNISRANISENLLNFCREFTYSDRKFGKYLKKLQKQRENS